MKRILIIEDEVDVADMLQALLSACGYQVDTASNGQVAVDYLLHNENPGLIFLDLTMPVMSGIQFLEQIESGAHGALSHIPIVVLSAVGDFLQIERFRCAGTLKKPASLDDILRYAMRHIA